MSEYQPYDDETLKNIQKVELSMLRDFVKICKENDINYFLNFGTAIGAVRHKGFIPWDDDIDICMLRSDYNKFVEVTSKGEIAQKYEMMSGANSDVYLVPEAHWQLKNTKFYDKPSLDYKNINLGIFLDLFVYDNLADDEKLAKKQERKCHYYRMLMIIRTMSHPIVPWKGFIGKLASAVLFVLHYILVAIRLNRRWLFNKYTETSIKYNDIKTRYVISFRSQELDRSKMTYDEIFPLIEFPYEDTKVYLPHAYDKMLTTIFGDYMQIPPVESRHNHKPEILDFGDSLKNCDN